MPVILSIFSSLKNLASVYSHLFLLQHNRSRQPVLVHLPEVLPLCTVQKVDQVPPSYLGILKPLITLQLIHGFNHLLEIPPPTCEGYPLHRLFAHPDDAVHFNLIV